jgi:hypothetical protein
MLRRLLNRHSQVCVPEETKFIPEVYEPFMRFVQQGRYQAAVDLINRQPIVRRWDVHPSAEEIASCEGNNAYARAIDVVMTKKANKHDKRYWGEKTPSYIRELPLLNRIFPRARFIHLHRDGRDVALSVTPLKWGPNNVYASARWWRQAIRAWEDARPLLGNRALETSYETFVHAPARELRAICEFLDLPHEAQMLQGMEIRKDRCKRWRNKFHMSVRERELFEYAAGDTLEQLGYERSVEAPSVSAGLRWFALLDDLYKQMSNRILRR